ncbi:hypothetical protein Syncc9605_0778 [Synechococcus sp. CC9605]|nr:hypothetical protein Syncc9605_0778 [Synechococcus sp. CC9605]
MKLNHLISPKNDDRSIDHRYVPAAKAIAELAGKRVEAQLHKLYVETNRLEKESASAGLQLVIALFSVPMDERYERSKFKKHIREQLQEIGFKKSKVSKLMGAGEFYARNHNQPLSTVCFEEFFTELELVERQNRFLDEYFKNVSKLYELSLMSNDAVDQVRRELLDDNKVYTQAELEELRRSNPKDEYEWRARTPSRANVQETRPTHALTTHESLEVMDDAKEESFIAQPEWGQKLVKQFFLFLASGEMDQCLAGFAPAAKAHLIDEVEAVQSLLEEFIAKHQPIEVTPIH